jgi:hypothetical protein
MAWLDQPAQLRLVVLVAEVGHSPRCLSLPLLCLTFSTWVAVCKVLVPC